MGLWRRIETIGEEGIAHGLDVLAGGTSSRLTDLFVIALIDIRRHVDYGSQYGAAFFDPGEAMESAAHKPSEKLDMLLPATHSKRGAGKHQSPSAR